MKLEGKVALVTGGGRGIGRGIARRFAAEGASVVIAQRDPESAARTVAEIEQDGGRAMYVQTDVSVPEQAARMVAACDARHGRLDILVNNAGLTGLDKSII